jgi:hypothetical protein
VRAQVQIFELIKLFQEAPAGEKSKIKLALLNAISKAQVKGQTYLAATYRQTYRKLEYEQ